MSISDVRDLVVVVAGILYAIITLILFVIAAGVLFFGMKGMRALDGLMEDKVTPSLRKALELSQTVRDRTATLPGAPGSSGGVIEVVNAANSLRQMEPPFTKKKKSWLPF